MLKLIGLIGLISLPNLKFGPLQSLEYMLYDLDLIQLMKCTRELYKRDYPHLKMKFRYAADILICGMQIPKIEKIYWNINWNFSKSRWPNVKYIYVKFINQSIQKSIIANLDSFKYVNLWNCRLSYNDIEYLCSMLSKNTSLLELNLGYIHLGPSNTSHMVDALVNNKSLTTLNLSRCNLGNYDLFLLLEALIHNRSLIHLNLSNNFINSEGVYPLIEVIKSDKCALKYLNLLYNCIEMEGRFSLLKLSEKIRIDC